VFLYVPFGHVVKQEFEAVLRYRDPVQDRHSVARAPEQVVQLASQAIHLGGDAC